MPKKNVKKFSQKRPVLLVTGMAGAGLSTAMKALEDLGYQAVDNLPLALVPELIAHKKGAGRPLAVGIDSRAWDFAASGLLSLAESLRKNPKIDFSLVFIDCQNATLQQRFTETRRIHPLAVDRPVIDGVKRDRKHTAPLQAASDIVIDTTDLKARDLRRLMGGHFALQRDGGMQVFITSFGFKHGVPRDADTVFDARFLDNPYWNKKLRPLSGRDKAVSAHIAKDRDYKEFFARVTHLLDLLLPRYVEEGRNYLTVAIGCTGGRHRSVHIAEELFRWAGKKKYNAALRHRDIDKEHAQETLPKSRAAKGASGKTSAHKAPSKSFAPSKAPAPVGRKAARGASPFKRRTKK